jgi:hypothetical protein
MAKNKVIKPGKWGIVRFRRIDTYAQVTGYMVCDNGYRAGHSGFDRKTYLRRTNGKRTRAFRPRKWTLKGWDNRRLAYKFAELKDLNKSIRIDLVRNWIKNNEAFLEIIEVEGCLFYGTVTSETVIHRKFAPETNEMEILAIEHALGE